MSEIKAEKPEAPVFPSREHDHEHCIDDAVDAAERLCRERGLRFTWLRRRVLEIIWSTHAPIGAYDILGILKSEHRSSAPPTVYRALEFLVEHGFVHKIESLNAFVGCTRPDGSHVGQFLICSNCRQVAELDDPEIAALIAARAARAGFDVSRQTVELQGYCEDCAANAGG